MRTTLLVWSTPHTAAQARAVAVQAHARRDLEVLVAGTPVDGARCVEGAGRGAQLKAALRELSGEALVLMEPEGYGLDALARLTAPIERDQADVVLGRRERRTLTDSLVAGLVRLALEQQVADPLCGQKAIRTSALRELRLSSDGDDIEAEVLMKLAAHLFRFGEAAVTTDARSPGGRWSQARTFLRYATVSNDADNEHEGYSTLNRLEAGAPNYNAWLGERFRRHAGARVLEIGAGIGTITAHLAPGREKVVALEVEPFYIRRLHNRFRGQPAVEPYQSDVALADWKHFQAQRFDTIVLSNVLEHIDDDGGAVQTFARILPEGGKLLVLVPALAFLFGSLDEAVGHHRRYTPATLRDVLEQNGFTVESLEWMNLAGIAGWFLNGRVLKRRVLPPLQLRLYDQLAPVLARAEAHLKLPVGMSLFCVARRDGPSAVPDQTGTP